MGDKGAGKTDMEENLLLSNELSCGNKGYQSTDNFEMEDTLILDHRVKAYGLLDDLKNTESFLLTHPDIIEGPTVLQLLQWCTTLKNDTETFNKVSRQCIYIIYLYDLSREVNIEPNLCIGPFFDKIQEPSFHERFENEVFTYRTKLQAMTFKELLSEVVICSSPASPDDGSSTSSSSSESCSIPLDPLQVYKSLPPQIQQCLDDEDLVALEYELSQFPQERAKELFVRLLRSGLLLPIQNNQSNGDDDTSSSVDTKFDSEISSSYETEAANCLNEKINMENSADTADDNSDSLHESSSDVERNKQANSQ